MSWFLFALLAATLFSSSILCDKIILNRYFDKISELSLTTAAALAGFPLLIIFYFIVGSVPDTRTFLTGLVAGWLIIAAFQLYYKALNRSDPALVTTLFQLVLPINFVLGLTLFNEDITSLQVLGIVIIAISSLVISLEEKQKKWRLRSDVLLLMLSASVLVSFSDVVFKLGAQNAPFAELALAEYASSVLAGVLLFASSKKVRQELESIRKKAKRTFTILQFNEALNLGGTLAIRFALISGPIALVQGVMGLQPFIVLIIGSILAYFGVNTNRSKKKRSRNAVLAEFVAIIAVCSGSVLISGAVNK